LKEGSLGIGPEPSLLESFHFELKVKKDMLKKKVLLLKDQVIEVGMITVY
jgi:hypothetical protein